MLAVILFSLIFSACGLLLGFSSQRLKNSGHSLEDQIDALLPQTQCGQCGYPGCKPYAQAIAQGNADINQCPPGGDACVTALAELLGREYKPLDVSYGENKEPAVAIIDEPQCIGCALCLQACPVDAIIGASRYLHTVIASECTGCELCIPVCPVDCIHLVGIQSDFSHRSETLITITTA